MSKLPRQGRDFSFVTGLPFGLLPALRLSMPDVNNTLKTSTRLLARAVPGDSR